MCKFKIGDIVSFKHFRGGIGEVLLVNEGGSLIVDVGDGNGHDGIVPWSQALGWDDDRLRCWFVPPSACTLVKSKVVFKGNIK